MVTEEIDRYVYFGIERIAELSKFEHLDILTAGFFSFSSICIYSNDLLLATRCNLTPAGASEGKSLLSFVPAYMYEPVLVCGGVG